MVIKTPLLCFFLLLLSACSNKGVSFVGPKLERPAYDGTLARVSIYGISDGDTQAELQNTAKKKFQDNRSLFSGSSNNLYTLSMNVSTAKTGVQCDENKLSYISKGSLNTSYILATLERNPQDLFNADIETRGQHETSVLAPIQEIVKCGSPAMIATDAVSRSMRIFDLLVKRENGMDVSKEMASVRSDKDLQGSAIILKAISGALYAIVVPVATTVEAAADADWGGAISAAAKAADKMPAASYSSSRQIRPSMPIAAAPQAYGQAHPTQSPQQKATSNGASRASAVRSQQTSASKPKPAARIVKVELQARGTTNMYFPYDQALDLATTNADTQARRQCRESYKGRITSLAKPNMVKKECDESRSQQYRCVVQITHTCEYKKP